MIIFMIVWLSLLTGGLVGMVFRQNEMQRLLDEMLLRRTHLVATRKGPVAQDNDPNPRG
jgi:hypothetical protein